MNRRWMLCVAASLPLLGTGSIAQAQTAGAAPPPVRVGRRRRAPGYVLAIAAAVAGLGGLAWWRARARRQEAERALQRETARLQAARRRAQAGGG